MTILQQELGEEGECEAYNPSHGPNNDRVRLERRSVSFEEYLGREIREDQRNGQPKNQRHAA